MGKLAKPCDEDGTTLTIECAQLILKHSRGYEGIALQVNRETNGIVQQGHITYFRYLGKPAHRFSLTADEHLLLVTGIILTAVLDGGRVARLLRAGKRLIREHLGPCVGKLLADSYFTELSAAEGYSREAAAAMLREVMYKRFPQTRP